MSYDYKDGKKRILEILDSQNETQKSDRIPSKSAFTFDNGYFGYVTAVFVDICDSTTLFTDNSLRMTTRAKIIRCFTSEIISILDDDPNLRDIGIRGDCVFAIYTSPNYENDYEIFDRAVYINTFSKMLNALLKKRNIPGIYFGIGIATDNELVVKAGRKGSTINDLVWIGEAVTFASHFSNIANRNNIGPIVVSENFYKNLSRAVEKNNHYNLNLSWFTDFNTKEYHCKQCDVVKTAMRNWIEQDMPDEGD